MASIVDCIARAMADPDQLVGGRQGAAAIELAQELEAQYGRHFDPATAQALAADHVKTVFEREAGRQRREVLARVRTAARMKAAVETHHGPSGKRDPAAALLALLEWREGSSIDSVRSMKDAMMRQFSGEISKVLTRHGKDLLGRVRDPAALREIVSELHQPGSTKSAAAKEMAEAVSAAFERARLMFNSFGGDIGKLERYGLPHAHSVEKLREAGFETWAAAIQERLDWDQIQNFSTGKAFGAPDMDFLKRIYDRITTRGEIDREPSFQGGGRALSKSRDDHRFLHFKSGEDWMAYNEAFGTQSPFDSIISHLDGMARDIALLRVLGPNPKQGLDYAVQIARKAAATAKDPKLEREVSSAAVTARAMLSHIDGNANRPGDSAWAGFLAGTRNILTAAQLGSAVLSSTTDLVTVRMAAKSIGMSGGGAYGRAMKLMASQTSREEAAAMGYVAETLLNTSSASARFLGEVWSPESTRRVSDAVLRASGLSIWTDSLRNGFQMELAAHIGAQAGKAFRDIDPALRKAMERRGFTEADWDQLRAAPLFNGGGGSFLVPSYFRQTAKHLDEAGREGLATRLQAFMDEQTNYAVPTASIEARARVTGDAPPGTVWGEVMRSGMMYKNYAVTMALMQTRRAMAQETRGAAAWYGIKYLGGAMLLGGLAIQLKEVSKGRDPRDMTEGKFWASAFVQGGGLGIFGDFLYSTESRAGGGLASTVAGPVFGAAGDAVGMFTRAASAAAKGEEMRLGREFSNFARRNAPGSSLWYARLALDRGLWDQVQYQLDPEAEAQWRQQERKRIKEYGNESFWGRGELTPDRAPDMGAAFG